MGLLKSFFSKSGEILSKVINLFRLDRSAIRGSQLFIVILFTVLILKILYFNNLKNKIRNFKIKNKNTEIKICS